MSLQNYINGRRKGKEAHRLEKEAMKDPFLQEAIDGFDSVEGNHMAHLASLQRRISKVQHRAAPHKGWMWKAVAAAILLLVAITSPLLFFIEKSGSMYAQTSSQYPIDLYLPDDMIYEEHIIYIAKMNTESTKNISIKVSNNEENKKAIKVDKTDDPIENINEMQTIDILYPTDNNERD